MKHQTNMRGSKNGDPSEFHRLPNLSAIFGNAFTPALGNGLRITYGLETHCRSNSVRSVQPSTLPTRLTVTRGDKAQSPFSIACGPLPRAGNGRTGFVSRVPVRSPISGLLIKEAQR